LAGTILFVSQALLKNILDKLAAFAILKAVIVKNGTI
jgi:hypothetical protein